MLGGSVGRVHSVLYRQLLTASMSAYGNAGVLERVLALWGRKLLIFTASSSHLLECKSLLVATLWGIV